MAMGMIAALLASEEYKGGQMIRDVVITLVVWCGTAGVLFYLLMWILRPFFNRARNEMGRDRGVITQFKADSLSEKQARKIYGDREVDRFLQHGDYYEHQQRITYNPMYDPPLTLEVAATMTEEEARAKYGNLAVDNLYRSVGYDPDQH